MKTTGILLITLMLLASTYQVGCGVNCMECNDGDECTTCFRRKLKGTGCEPNPPSPTENCEVYNLDAPGCQSCSEGFGNNIFIGDSCKPHSIDSCVVGLVSDEGAGCFACKNGKPTNDWSKCVPFTEDEKNLNCRWAFNINGEVSCARCNAGYSNRDNKCVTSSIEGCMVHDTNEGNCKICDAWDGYFASDSKHCQKFSVSEKETKAVTAGIRSGLVDMFREIARNRF